MPAEVPGQFQNEPEYSLWRNIARLQEDYDGGVDSFVTVARDITTRLENAKWVAGAEGRVLVNDTNAPQTKRI